MIGWRQGEWVTLPDGADVASIVPGPSLFETFAVRGGRVACLGDHLDRLAGACPRLGLDPARLMLGADASAARWSVPLGALLGRNGLTDAIVRLLVAPRGDGLATEWLTVRALPTTPPALDLYELTTRRDAPEWLPRPKSGPWRNSSDAWRELRALADRPDAEGVQFDARGCLSEGPRSSFAWWDGASWNFPAPETGRLPGTAQAQLRSVLAQAGRPLRDVSWPGFPTAAEAVLALRSTFDGGAVPARSYQADGRLAWRPPGVSAEATRALALLAAWRAQRCISFA
jgi:branched-subunit amino acid aminotransferase/4-amino-4-deoxychorismate lyase